MYPKKNLWPGISDYLFFSVSVLLLLSVDSSANVSIFTIFSSLWSCVCMSLHNAIGKNIEKVNRVKYVSSTELAFSLRFKNSFQFDYLSFLQSVSQFDFIIVLQISRWAHLSNSSYAIAIKPICRILSKIKILKNFSTRRIHSRGETVKAMAFGNLNTFRKKPIEHENKSHQFC